MIGASLLLAAARRSSLLDGLAGYWPMNGNGNDVLGVSNGVLFGTGSSFGAGRVGQAFHSIGNARYELGSNAQIKPTTAITLGGWFWFNGSQGGNARLCADWHQNGSIDRWIFPYVPDGITMQLHMFGVSTTLGVLGSTISAATWALLRAARSSGSTAVSVSSPCGIEPSPPLK